MSKTNGSANLHTVVPGDPTFLFHRGEGYVRHRLPVGTTVIYPHEPLEPLADRRGAIEHAIDHPESSDPLDAHLKPGMTVTIAFDDISLPLPRMPAPDIRQTIIELVLERLDRAGVTDIELICAICLHRRCTPAEIKHFVGPTVFKRFWPKRLYNHDAEDPDGIIDLGKTETGEVVADVARSQSRPDDSTTNRRRAMSERPFLGEFELLIMLAVLRLGESAYAVTIRRELGERSGSDVAMGAVYATLDRLEEKEFVNSEVERRTGVLGRPRRYYGVLPAGLTALTETRDIREAMWRGLTIAFGGGSDS